MTAAGTSPRADWRFRYADGRGISQARNRLHAAGYGLTRAADGAGWWLVGAHGSQWFSSWQAAYQSVADGCGALVRLEGKLSE